MELFSGIEYWKDLSVERGAELEQLRATVAEQQKRIAELEREVERLNIVASQVRADNQFLRSERPMARKLTELEMALADTEALEVGTAERCEKLMKQRDELVGAADCLIRAMAGTQAETDFAFQMYMLEDSLASVKESK